MSRTPAKDYSTSFGLFKFSKLARRGVSGAEQKERILNKLQTEIGRIIEATHVSSACVLVRIRYLDFFRLVTAVGANA
jgi:hypothetical protein